MSFNKALGASLKLVRCFLRQPRDTLWFLGTYRQWQRNASPAWQARLSEVKPYLYDRHDAAGSARGHYFLQDIWAARHVFQYGPTEHVDVGSRVDGFVAHVASFCPVNYVDIRTIETGVPGLTGLCGNVCNLPFGDLSIASLSCLHVIEHIGLGRYGDPIDPEGWLKGLKELQRVLKPGGQLLIGTPCGRQRVVFHAHRVFDPKSIVAAMPELTLREFSLIKDGRATHWNQNVSLDAASALEYGCGLFAFTRLRN